MMIFIAAITIGAIYFFRVPSRLAHIVMTVAVAAVIGAIFVLIAELDLPFRGDPHISPEAYAADTRIFELGY